MVQRPRHLLIGGTGRAGTSFLVRWLEECGLNVGSGGEWFADARSGLEHSLSDDPDLPFVVKSPWLHEYLETVLASGRVEVVGIIAPIRDLAEAAESRLVQTRAVIAEQAPECVDWASHGHVPGGVVYSLLPHDQESVLARGLTRLIETASRHRISLALPHFPEMVEDFDALWPTVEPLLGDLVERSTARAAFSRVAQPDLVRVRTASPSSTPQDALQVELARRLTTTRVELDRVRGDLEGSRAEMAACRSSREEANQEMAHLQRELERASALREEVERELLKVQSDLEEVRGRLALAHQALESVMASRSWRMTAPLRRTRVKGSRPNQ